MTLDHTDDWFSPDYSTFGDRVAAARETAGLSQKDLAARLGVSRTTLTSWEDDRSEPRANRLQMLAGMLNVSITWLLNGEGPGVDAPGGDDVADGLEGLLADVQEMRRQLERGAERMVQIEQRLRAALKAVRS